MVLDGQDQDWIRLIIFKNFADQDWIGFNYLQIRFALGLKNFTVRSSLEKSRIFTLELFQYVFVFFSLLFVVLTEKPFTFSEMMNDLRWLGFALRLVAVISRVARLAVLRPNFG